MLPAERTILPSFAESSSACRRAAPTGATISAGICKRAAVSAIFSGSSARGWTALVANDSPQARFQSLDHPANILVFRRTEEQGDHPAGKIIFQCLGQFFKTIDIMGRIQHHRRLPPDNFEPAGPGYRSHTLLELLFRNIDTAGLEGSIGCGGIDDLVDTQKGERESNGFLPIRPDLQGLPVQGMLAWPHKTHPGPPMSGGHAVLWQSVQGPAAPLPFGGKRPPGWLP